MEAHIIQIMRFAICMLTMFVSVPAIFRARTPKVRRLTAILAAFLIFFNERAGVAAYLILRAMLEMLAALAVLGFFLIAGATLMILPIAGVIRWIKQ